MSQDIKEKSWDECSEEEHNEFALIALLFGRACERHANKEITDDDFNKIRDRLVIELDKLERKYSE